MNNMGNGLYLLQAMNVLLDNSDEIILLKDSNLKYITASRAFLRFIQVKNVEEIAGKTDYDFFEKMLSDQYQQEEHTIIKSGKPIINRIEPLLARAEQKRYIAISKFPIYDKGKVMGICCIAHDVTNDMALQENIKQVKQLKLQVNTDALTGLLSRNLMREHIESFLDNVGDDQGYGLVLIDLDHFKNVNDSFGHLAGDKVLMEVAEELKAAIEAGDMVSRIGGDEFMVFLHNVQSKIWVEHWAQDLLARFTLLCHEDSDVCMTTCSIGISLDRGQHNSFETLYHQADQAMYLAKQSGRNQMCFSTIGQ